MKESRRRFLKFTGLAAAAGATIGYKDTLGAATRITTRGTAAKDPVYGNAEAPEVRIDSAGEVQVNPDFTVASTVCIGCTTQCGIRVKIDNQTGEVVRAAGNPYNPLSSDPWLPYNSPLRESLRWTSAHRESGLANRSTTCARGNVVFDKIHDKFRVLTPLKRAGKRGENRWVAISPEQLVVEIVQGGNLFGEGHVDGLAAIRDLKSPIDPENPEYGTRANQLGIIGTTNEGRQDFMVQRFLLAFGSKNFAGHTAICGLSMRAGNAAFLGDFEKYPHLKPDFENCEFLINFGTSPGQAGNPFKRQAKLLARARSEGKMKYVTITPLLTNSDSIAAGDRSRWLPIRPGGDLPLAMGMIRWIIENGRHNAEYLSIPGAEAMQAAGEPTFTNASHLVVVEEGHPLNGKFLSRPVSEETTEYFVLDAADGKLKPAAQVARAQLEVDGTVPFEGKPVAVKSSFVLLRESATRLTLEEYAQESGVPLKEIVRLADEFTSHGRRAAVDCHGNTMQTTGFYTTYAILTLGALIGNLNYKGGASAGGGKFRDLKGAKYDFTAYAKPKQPGIRIDRTRFPYEKTSEFARRKEEGKPYPARNQWYPLANALETEFITASINRYPYPLKALISWNANFIYGESGAQNTIAEPLRDPQKSIPLFVAIDPFINETSILADYIVPDSVLYETWGHLGPWGGWLTRASMVRYPVIEPRQVKFANGEPVCMDSFVIEVGKRLGLPGFGEGAIVADDGSSYPLERPEDYYLRAFENIALDGQQPVPDASDEEIALAGLSGFVPGLQRISPENWRKVAFVMARGGRYEGKGGAYKGEHLGRPYQGSIHLYNERVGNTRNSLTGERYSGVPAFYKARFVNGELLESRYAKKEFPLLAFSYKSNVVSAPNTASVRLRDLRYTNAIDLNAATAARLGIRHGDPVRVTSPGGSIEGLARLRQGLQPESVGIEHGFGREGEGASTMVIDGKALEGLRARKSGANINKLGFADPTRPGSSALADFAIGSNARQAVPVRVERIG